jgi:hypothetical protein
MKKTILILISIFSTIILAFGAFKYPPDINTSFKHKYQDYKDSLKSEYFIDNKMVTKEKFNNFLSSLKENTGSWFCAETKNGGITGYDAKDIKGKIYEVRFYYESGNSKSTIKKK